ncbi:unnamed protein product [Linum trigynum]|uniref:Cytochrome b5 heme-binding domain-containing protein n=1 Tax=Linum trigynum TaxID=586398 RepID=A0AAV2CU92_9ROSI
MAVEKKYITSEDLKKHNKPGDLWISIQGKVYDVSEWVKRHPGGEVAIANVADAFIAYHPGTAWKNLDPLFTGYHLEDYAVSDVSKDYYRLAAEFSKLGLFDKKGHVAVAALFSLVICNISRCSPRANDWFEKQTRGTVDISCPSWMDWFHGGLQFQLEHHLFPRLPRCQLRKVSLLVQDLCKKQNLPYRSYSFVEANVWTIKTLRAVAVQVRDLANPVPKNMVWEAVHTHG